MSYGAVAEMTLDASCTACGPGMPAKRSSTPIAGRRTASLVAALGLGAVLSCGSVQGGEGKLNVSAVVLARTSCTWDGLAIDKVLRCTGSDVATIYRRVAASAVARRASGIYTVTVVNIEF